MSPPRPIHKIAESDLPGPVFHRQGKAESWWIQYWRGVTGVTAVLVIAMLVGYARYSSPLQPTTSPDTAGISLTPAADYLFTARAGQGMVDLARIALDSTMAGETQLDAAQRLFATDRLARIVGWRALHAGEVVAFSSSAIADAITQALTLSPSEHAAWVRLLR